MASAPRTEPPRDRLDLRLVPVALALWAGTFTGLACTWGAAAAVGVFVTVTTVAAVAWMRPSGRRRAVAVAGLCLVAGLAVGASRAAPMHGGPVTDLAEAGAYVEIEGVLTGDPVERHRVAAKPAAEAMEAGDEQTYVVGRIRVERISGRSLSYELRSPVLFVTGETSWAALLPGQRIRTGGIVEPSRGRAPDVAAVLRPRAGPELIGAPSTASRLTEPLRAGLRASVSGLGPDARGLIPGLVVGDESLMTDHLRQDMKAAGLAHLTAVSGTNITIVLVVVLAVARWSGLRSYALPVVGLLAVVGFVLLARPDPSVLRAAAMGVVAVVGLTVAGRRRGLPALAAAATLLLLIDPWLARSVGFALSVLATAGILALVPHWQRAMWWLPRPLAVAIVVPLAAQVACTPMLLAVSGELSLASLPANVLAAPAVAPATIFGVVAAAISPLAPTVAAWSAWVAGIPAWWIATLAHWFAERPGATMPWVPGAAGVVTSVTLALVAVAAMPLVLRRPVVSLAAGAALTVGLLRALPSPGWPPPEWLVVACDVGQGDAVVLRAGEHTAVVVDAGREPAPVRRCLDELDVHTVPLLVLSHFDLDHVGGVRGVLDGRHVGRALVSPLREPADNAADVTRRLDEAGVPMSAAEPDQRIAVGDQLTLEVLWPRRLISAPESVSNNASVVLDAEVDGVDVLLTGDLEPAAQRALMRSEPRLSTDVLKVAHHGSPNQHHGLLTGLDARIALISVGDDNAYGHPAPSVLDTLRAGGVRTFRTDHDGAVAVVRGPAGLGVVTRDAALAP